MKVFTKEKKNIGRAKGASEWSPRIESTREKTLASPE